ncbi:MAG: Rpn family recombination-promoting nuclease/putative transposase [Myxococcota bacterium]
MPQLIRFDWAIKHILRDKANFDVLEGFLSELTGMDLTIVELLESEGNQNTKEDKFNRVDILVATQTGERIIVEVQCEKQLDYLSRILYGTSKVLTESMRKGHSYRHVKKIICVTIAYFDLGHGDDYVYRGDTKFVGIHTHHVLQLSPEEQALYQKKSIADIYPQYYIIQVNNFDQETRDNLDEWIYFLKTEKLPKHYKAKGLQAAAEKLNVLKLTDAQRRSYDRYIESLMDQQSYYESTYVQGHGEGLQEGLEKGRQEGLQQGHEKGHQEGLQEGAKKRAIEIAKALKAKGVDYSIISEASGLSQEEIKAL